jgi:F-type H+-transporting ATPase subunit delta
LKLWLRGYVSAVIEEADAAVVSGELRSFSDLVARNAQLAGALSDIGIPAASRRAVVVDLLSGRASEATSRIVSQIAVHERASDFLPGVEDSAEQVRVADEIPADERDAEEPVVGRTSSRELIAGYSAAVFEGLDSVADIEESEDELFRLARIVESSPDLRSALVDPSRSVPDRQALVTGLIEGKVRPQTLRLARAALRGRVRDFVGVLDWLAEQAAEARGWRIARVRAARGIAAASGASLEGVLRTITGRPVELQVTEDASLLGGAVIQIGDLLVDASVEHRLTQLQEHLMGVLQSASILTESSSEDMEQ